MATQGVLGHPGWCWRIHSTAVVAADGMAAADATVVAVAGIAVAVVAAAVDPLLARYRSLMDATIQYDG